jgi:hypothetical protein
VSYKVITRTSAPGYRQQAEVIRRFKDFVWLQHRLRHELRGALVVFVRMLWLTLSRTRALGGGVV